MWWLQVVQVTIQTYSPSGVGATRSSSSTAVNGNIIIISGGSGSWSGAALAAARQHRTHPESAKSVWKRG